MNLLFVYSFSRIWNIFAEGWELHKPIFATFRQEFANEDVSPLYVFTRNYKSKFQNTSLLSDKEIVDAFQFTTSLGWVTFKERDTIKVGRAYEQFYYDIFKTENIDVIVNYNISFGFQQIGYMLAKKLKIKNYVAESGYFRPFTLTLEKDGINAFSKMQSVNYFDERDKVNLGHAYGDLSQMQNALENKKKYFTCAIPTFREKPFFRILKELRQRFSYRRIDTEIYSQKWLQRLFIMILNGLWFVKNNNQPKSDYILVLLSSRYDPQLPIPSKIYLESTIEIIIDAFEIAKKEGMFKDTCLLIKEHPHDYSREILCSKWKTFFNSDIYWIDKRKDNVNLMNAARSIVVMNSSVGIEALMRRKSIVCLLPSIYNHKDIVINVSYPYRIDNLVNALIQSVSFKPDIVEVNSILSSILMRTQLSTLGYDDWKAGIKTEFNRRVTF